MGLHENAEFTIQVLKTPKMNFTGISLQSVATQHFNKNIHCSRICAKDLNAYCLFALWLCSSNLRCFFSTYITKVGYTVKSYDYSAVNNIYLIYTYSKTSRNGVARIKVLKIFGGDQMLCGLLSLKLKLFSVHFTIKGTMIKFRQIRLSCNNKSGYHN